MCAGVAGQGAGDAAYATAVLFENAQLKEEDVTGGTADIFKCFDQLLRPLVYKILETSGVPNKMGKAYERFQE